MRATRLEIRWAFWGMVVFLGILSLISTTVSHAQCTGSPGTNAVYAYCGTNSALGTVGSSAFTDANEFISVTT